jgi:hypothetical protein
MYSVSVHTLLTMTSFDIAPRSSFQPLFLRIYDQLADDGNLTESVTTQEIALVYAVLAMGVLHDLEVQPNDASADDFLRMAKLCLVKGDFMSNNAVAGLQTLVGAFTICRLALIGQHIMAHCYL